MECIITGIIIYLHTNMKSNNEVTGLEIEYNLNFKLGNI